MPKRELRVNLVYNAVVVVKVSDIPILKYVGLILDGFTMETKSGITNVVNDTKRHLCNLLIVLSLMPLRRLFFNPDNR